MSYQRSIIAIAFLGTLALTLLRSSNAHNITGKGHHLFIGSHVWGDHLIQREIVQKSGSWYKTGPKVEKTFTGDNNSKITYIQVLDQARDGDGGYATLTNGGPGNLFATLTFKNGWRKSLDFIVEIYGKS